MSLSVTDKIMLLQISQGWRLRYWSLEWECNLQFPQRADEELGQGAGHIDVLLTFEPRQSQLTGVQVKREKPHPALLEVKSLQHSFR